MPNPGIFENALKKLSAVKNAILAIFGGYYIFLVHFKNIDQNNICVSTVFKVKTKEKYEEIFF